MSNHAQTSPYYQIDVVEPRAPGEVSYVRMARTEERYPNVEAIHADRRAVLHILDPHAALPLLLDMRRGPIPPSDPAAEQALARGGQEVTGRFKRVAVLVRNNVGSLQVRRVARTVAVEVHVFTDEREALAFLHG